MKTRFAFWLVVVFSLFAGAVTAAEIAGDWIDLPFVAQTKDGCGSAVISMVMQYWSRQLGSSGQVPSAWDPKKIQQLLFVPAEKGIPATAMLAYFQGNGYRTFAFRGEWNDLRHQLSQGRPLIVSLRASGRHGPLHYAVIAGIDWERAFVFLDDPARGKMLRLSREGFLREWNPANNWTLLILPAN